jgi:hypothetical protein
VLREVKREKSPSGTCGFGWSRCYLPPKYFRALPWEPSSNMCKYYSHVKQEFKC